MHPRLLSRWDQIGGVSTLFGTLSIGSRRLQAGRSKNDQLLACQLIARRPGPRFGRWFDPSPRRDARGPAIKLRGQGPSLSFLVGFEKSRRFDSSFLLIYQGNPSCPNIGRLLWTVANSISHHLRSPRMLRFLPVNAKQWFQPHGLKVVPSAVQLHGVPSAVQAWSWTAGTRTTPRSAAFRTRSGERGVAVARRAPAGPGWGTRPAWGLVGFQGPGCVCGCVRVWMCSVLFVSPVSQLCPL